MVGDASVNGMIAFGLVFGLVWSVGLIVFLRAYGDKRRALSRLRDLSAKSAPAPRDTPKKRDWTGEKLPLIGALFLPKEANQLEHIRELLSHAGIFHAHGPQFFLGAKWLLMLLLPVVAGFVPLLLGWLAPKNVPVFALSACVLGMWAPHLWLRSRVLKRQRLLRSGLADTLDMLVLCLEGGVSLIASIQRVTSELHAVHAELGAEMNILEREVQLGLSPGEAFKKLAKRCGLEEVRDLASMILQSEQYGASVAKAFRTYADSYRLERQQRAEEMAQKAAVKILFPTLLFIFPAIFIVLLGPAAFQMAKMFAR
jgi:tight adherence protein C